MDFFSVLNQRQLDQNSELRRLSRISACYAVAATLMLFVSSIMAPAAAVSVMDKGGSMYILYALVFTCGSVSAYIIMVKSLNVLCNNRFIYPSSYTVAHPMTSLLLVMGPHDALGCGKRFVLLYGLMSVALFSTYVGLTTKTYSAHLLLMGLQLALFAFLWCLLRQMMNPSR